MGTVVDERGGERIVTEDADRIYWRSQLIGRLAEKRPDEIARLRTSWQASRAEFAAKGGADPDTAWRIANMAQEMGSFVSLYELADAHQGDYPALEAYLNAVISLALVLHLTQGGEVAVWACQHIHGVVNPDGLPADIFQIIHANAIQAFLSVSVTPYHARWRTTRFRPKSARPLGKGGLPLSQLTEHLRELEQATIGEGRRPLDWKQLEADLHDAIPALIASLKQRLGDANVRRRPTTYARWERDVRRLADVLCGARQRGPAEHQRIRRFCRVIELDTPDSRTYQKIWPKTRTGF